MNVALDDLCFPLARALAGFARTELLADVLGGGAHTLVAPVDAAFDGLPWTFDELLSVDRVEECFELFEYYAVPARCEARSPARAVSTLQREPITIGAGQVVGRRGIARILGSSSWGQVLIHVVDGCVLPSTLRPSPPRWTLITGGA